MISQAIFMKVIGPSWDLKLGTPWSRCPNEPFCCYVEMRWWALLLLCWKNVPYPKLWTSMHSILGKKKSGDSILKFFLIFPRKEALTFHANCLLRRQSAWNVKAYFLGKIGKISLICRLLELAPRVIKVNLLREIKINLLWEIKVNLLREIKVNLLREVKVNLLREIKVNLLRRIKVNLLWEIKVNLLREIKVNLER